MGRGYRFPANQGYSGEGSKEGPMGSYGEVKGRGKSHVHQWDAKELGISREGFRQGGGITKIDREFSGNMYRDTGEIDIK